MTRQHHATKVRTPVGDQVAQPVRATGLTRWKVERACRKRIGHCWHPTDAMIAWFCCECGSERDGMPPQRCRICTTAVSSAVPGEPTEGGAHDA